MMEFQDVDVSQKDSDGVLPVDFLQELQQNISTFQTLLENLGSRVEHLENTASSHAKNCTCMRKTQTLVEPSAGQPSVSASPSVEAEAVPVSQAPSDFVQRQEIVRLEATVNELNSKFGGMRNDLKLLSNSIEKLKGQSSSEKKTRSSSVSPIVSTVSSSSTTAPAATSTQITPVSASKTLQRSANSQPRNPGTVLPRPSLMRAPASSLKLGNISINKVSQQKQQQKLPLRLPTTASVTITPSTRIASGFDNESDDDDMSDEYEGEENDGRQAVDDERQDDSFMHLQPEVILRDEDDDGEFAGPEHEQDGDDDEFMEFGLGTGNFSDDEGPQIKIEFRDKLRRIVGCNAYPRSGRIDCPECETRCMSRKNIIRHYNNKHADPKYYECSVCGAVLNRKDSLCVHLKNQHNIIEQDGSFVQGPSATEAQPSSSAAAETPASSSLSASNRYSGIQYSCNACGKSFSRAEALTSHNCVVKVPDAPVSSNGLLMSQLSSNRPLNQKIKSKPATRKILNPVIAKKCPICPNTFTARSDLVRHLKAHTLNNQCVACGKTYSRRDKLRGHQRKLHGQVVDDEYIEQNLLNPTYPDQNESGVIGYGDFDFGLGEDPNFLSTPMWAFS